MFIMMMMMIVDDDSYGGELVCVNDEYMYVK